MIGAFQALWRGFKKAVFKDNRKMKNVVYFLVFSAGQWNLNRERLLNASRNIEHFGVIIELFCCFFF